MSDFKFIVDRNEGDTELEAIGATDFYVRNRAVQDMENRSHTPSVQSLGDEEDEDIFARDPEEVLREESVHGDWADDAPELEERADDKQDIADKEDKFVFRPVKRVSEIWKLPPKKLQRVLKLIRLTNEGITPFPVGKWKGQRRPKKVKAGVDLPKQGRAGGTFVPGLVLIEVEFGRFSVLLRDIGTCYFVEINYMEENCPPENFEFCIGNDLNIARAVFETISQLLIRSEHIWLPKNGRAGGCFHSRFSKSDSERCYDDQCYAVYVDDDGDIVYTDSKQLIEILLIRGGIELNPGPTCTHACKFCGSRTCLARIVQKDSGKIGRDVDYNCILCGCALSRVNVYTRNGRKFWHGVHPGIDPATLCDMSDADQFQFEFAIRPSDGEVKGEDDEVIPDIGAAANSVRPQRPEEVHVPDVEPVPPVVHVARVEEPDETQAIGPSFPPPPPGECHVGDLPRRPNGRPCLHECPQDGLHPGLHYISAVLCQKFHINMLFSLVFHLLKEQVIVKPYTVDRRCVTNKHCSEEKLSTVFVYYEIPCYIRYVLCWLQIVSIFMNFAWFWIMIELVLLFVMFVPSMMVMSLFGFVYYHFVLQSGLCGFAFIYYYVNSSSIPEHVMFCPALLTAVLNELPRELSCDKIAVTVDTVARRISSLPIPASWHVGVHRFTCDIASFLVKLPDFQGLGSPL
jgi:hypothetical protein